jgi:protein LSM14
MLFLSFKGPETPQEEFDFQSKLAEFTKEEPDNDVEDDAGDTPEPSKSYDRDDFFDSISCDALDKQQGLDKRLRGAQERSLNTETFGAVALNSQRRRRRGGGRGGRGRGRGGRGRGRGRGRSNGSNSRWGFNNNSGTHPQAAAS